MGNLNKRKLMFKNQLIHLINIFAEILYLIYYCLPGVVQGMVTGMRGLCNGLGPAMFGVIFYLFHVDLNDEHHNKNMQHINHHHNDLIDTKLIRNETVGADIYGQLIPGPPFVFGALMVVVAILVAAFIPEKDGNEPTISRKASGRKRSIIPFNFSYLFVCV